jgi:hypothetical protein
MPPQAKQSQNMYQSNGDVLSHEPSETLVAHSTLSTSLNSFRRKLNKLVKKLRRTSPIQSAPIPTPVKLHSLVDRPISSPSKSSTAVLIEETPVTPSDSRHPTPPTEILAPAAVSYVRERPASKCFSTSEIRKMTADDITALRESKHSRKRSSKRRSRAAARSSWTPGALAVVVEVDEQDVELDGSIQSADSPSPAIEVEEVRPVPPLPPYITRSQLPSKMGEGTDELPVFDKAEITHPTAFSCFLQVGREDKMSPSNLVCPLRHCERCSSRSSPIIREWRTSLRSTSATPLVVYGMS